MNAFDYIQQLTKKDLALFRWQAGLDFLDYMDEPEQLKRELEKDKVFWKWWAKQFDRLTTEFLNEKDWESVNSQQVFTAFKSYTGQRKVGHYGQHSYCFLVATLLLPTYRKRWKERDKTKDGMAIL